MKEFEADGIWFLPSTPHNTVAGRISYSPIDGIHLNLIGCLEETHNISQYPFVLGVTTNGEEITLCDCMASFSMKMPGISTQSIVAQKGLIGILIDDDEKIIFPKASFTFTHFEEWLNISGFRQEQNFRKDLGKLQFDVRFIRPSEVKAVLPNGTLSTVYNFNYKPRLNSINMVQRSFFKVEATKDLTINQWFSIFIGPLQNFLTLATDKPNAITDIIFYSITDDGSDTNVKFIMTPLYHEEKEKELHPEDILFTYKNIEDIFKNVIEKWLTVSEEIRTVFNLFFSTRYKPSTYLESRFLNIVQTVEIYHRIRFNNYILPKKEHKDKIKSIIDNTPDEYKQWIREQLAYSNEPRLFHRIMELIELSRDIILPLIKDGDKFARKIADTRNYYTHYNPRLIERAAHKRELYWTTEVLSILIQRCFLYEIGFTSESCVQLFSRNKRYQSIQKLEVEL